MLSFMSSQTSFRLVEENSDF